MSGLRLGRSAERQDVRSRPERGAGSRILAAIVVSFALVAAAFTLRATARWVTGADGFAVRRVTVSGTTHASVPRIVEASGALGRNVFRLDLADVRRRVALCPWVGEAAVSRSLPRGLRIVVTEKTPVALATDGDGALALLDGAGGVIERDVAPGAWRLPRIVSSKRGDGTDAVPDGTRAVATLVAVKQAAPTYCERITSVEVRSTGELVLAAAGHPPVIVSGPESARAVAGYACRAASVRRVLGPVAYVDARWRGRLFVGRAKS